jgi:hypothetical protein
MLYCWRSGYLRNYSDGQIIVQANSVSEAREKALAHFEADYNERFNPFSLELDQEDLEDKARWQATLVHDLEADPEELADCLLFILGSA